VQPTWREGIRRNDGGQPIAGGWKERTEREGLANIATKGEEGLRRGKRIALHTKYRDGADYHAPDITGHSRNRMGRDQEYGMTESPWQSVGSKFGRQAREKKMPQQLRRGIATATVIFWGAEKRKRRATEKGPTKS